MFSTNDTLVSWQDMIDPLEEVPGTDSDPTCTTIRRNAATASRTPHASTTLRPECNFG